MSYSKAQAETPQPKVVAAGRTVAGDKVRVYADGTGWDGSNGRPATADQVAEVSANGVRY